MKQRWEYNWCEICLGEIEISELRAESGRTWHRHCYELWYENKPKTLIETGEGYKLAD